MASYDMRKERLTVAETIAKYKYMRPDGIFCDGKRVTEKESKNNIVIRVTATDGIVYYYTTKA